MISKPTEDTVTNLLVEELENMVLRLSLFL